MSETPQHPVGSGDSVESIAAPIQEVQESMSSVGLESADPLSLASQLEALLYASGEPASLSALSTALTATAGEIEAALEELAAQYAVRGIRVQRSGNKVQLVTSPELAPKIQKFLGLEEVNRLSSAALETLAIIAYSQPITKPQLEMVRGVNCDGVINTLLARNLILELGRADSVGHPMRYGVSFEFLQYFGLRGVHELPPVEKLETLPIEKGGGDLPVIETPANAAPEDAATDVSPAEIMPMPADNDQVEKQINEVTE
jgi:segregation and condensation protein B